MRSQLVWLKRDLRMHHHRPLVEAARRGPVICLYVYEPEVYRSDEFDSSHLVFVNASLVELDHRLREVGGSLTYRVGSMPGVLDELARAVDIEAIWAHEETPGRVGRERNERVRVWAGEHGIAMHELPQDGVIRPLHDRDGWSARWSERMGRSLLDPPGRMNGVEGVTPESPRGPSELGLSESDKDEAVPGGETAALETLDSFLSERGVDYRRGMSSPVTGWTRCSRLGPHLAWGNVAIAHVHQALEARRRELREAKANGTAIDPRWLTSLSSFAGRLRWHCHFMQKLEDEPRIELENMARAYDGLRENEFDEARFRAWCEGRTGYPMVDACVRALHRGGWINFRMRAMLMSFASYHLWLHWRPTAVYLARHFLDFEPGIHFSQAQMQSGTTGINALRIYSPVKQARDQDPDGAFIRRYVPELADVPTEHIHEPHRMSATEQGKSGCTIGVHYPFPIVDHATAYRAARERMTAVRRKDESRQEARRVYRKHGSRRRPTRRRTDAAHA